MPRSDGSADMVARRVPVGDADPLAAQRRVRLRQQPGAAPRRAATAVLLLNPDTCMPRGGIAALLELLARAPEAGIVGPKLLRPDGTMHLACRRSFPTPSVAFYRFSGLGRLFPRSSTLRPLQPDLSSIPNLAVEVDSVCGACMLVRREVIERDRPAGRALLYVW